MKTSSCKAKGRRLQKTVVQKILAKFPHLTTRDVVSTSMGASGVDVRLSEQAFQTLPLSIECKNKEANKSLLDDWKQTLYNAHQGHPALILSANKSPVLAVVSLELLLHLFDTIYAGSNVTSKSEN